MHFNELKYIYLTQTNAPNNLKTANRILPDMDSGHTGASDVA